VFIIINGRGNRAINVHITHIGVACIGGDKRIHKNPFTQNNETSGSVEFLKPYPIIAADALTAITSSALLLNEHLS
jgi:hypothetical protein